MSDRPIPTTPGIYVRKDSSWTARAWTSVPNAAIRNPELSWDAKGALAWLSSHSETHKIDAEDLAAAGPRGRNHAYEMIRELEQWGWISRTKYRNPITGRYDVHIYDLHPEPLPEEMRTFVPSKAKPRPARMTPHKPSSAQLPDGPEVAEQAVVDSRGSAPARPGTERAGAHKEEKTSGEDQGSKSLINGEPLIIVAHARDEDRDAVEARGGSEHQTDAAVLGVQDQDLFGGDQLATNGSKPSKAQRDAEFAEFWRAYPRKRAQDAARRAWDKAVTKTDPSTLLTAVASYVEFQIRQYRDPKKRMLLTAYPATWLNDGRWKDELNLALAGDDDGHSNGYKPYTNPVNDSVYYEEIR